MWDNRQTMHRVRRYDQSQPRDMRRATVAGTAADGGAAGGGVSEHVVIRQRARHRPRPSGIDPATCRWSAIA